MHESDTIANFGMTFKNGISLNNVDSLNSHWLRRFTVGTSFGANANASLSLRSINGTGGFATPGLNLAASYHVEFRTGNELFVNYGTPVASTTLYRFVVKYLMRVGGGAGT